MATIIMKDKIENPIIVISGDYGVGKSYINNIIKKYLNSVISINKYDFITRKLLFMMGIHPTEVGYTLLATDLIDRELYSDNQVMLYLKDLIKKQGVVTPLHIKYFIENVFNNKINDMSFKDKIEHIVTGLNNILLSKKRIDKKFELYDITVYIFDEILSMFYNWQDKAQVAKYLDGVMLEYERIFTKYKYRMVYYAYSPEEMIYFKEKYNSQSMFIAMSHNLQSQLLLKNKQYDRVDAIVSDTRMNVVDQMKKLSSFVIVNDLEMEHNLVNKIMPQINI